MSVPLDLTRFTAAVPTLFGVDESILRRAVGFLLCGVNIREVASYPEISPHITLEQLKQIRATDYYQTYKKNRHRHSCNVLLESSVDAARSAVDYLEEVMSDDSLDNALPDPGTNRNLGGTELRIRAANMLLTAGLKAQAQHFKFSDMVEMQEELDRLKERINEV